MNVSSLGTRSRTARTGKLPRPRGLAIALGIVVAFHCNAETPASDLVEWLQVEDSECLTEGGKMVAVRGRHAEGTLKIWLERWYSGVKTADRGHHELAPGDAPLSLGCSITGGVDQRWELVTAEILPR